MYLYHYLCTNIQPRYKSHSYKYIALVPVWIQLLASVFWLFFFRAFHEIIHCSVDPVHYLRNPQTYFFNKTFIKNEFHKPIFSALFKDCGGQLYLVFKLHWRRPDPISSLICTNCGKKRPGPISSLRVREYSRTTSKRRDKITLRGEVKSACEEFDRVRGR